VSLPTANCIKASPLPIAYFLSNSGFVSSCFSASLFFLQSFGWLYRYVLYEVDAEDNCLPSISCPADFFRLILTAFILSSVSHTVGALNFFPLFLPQPIYIIVS